MSSVCISSESTCPACEAVPRCLGRMRLAGGNIALSEPGQIYECPTCGFLFRRPYPSPEELVDAYSELSAELWDNSSGRVDFNLAAEVIREAHRGGRVLDVGCFRGDFLDMLPSEFEKFGVEPVRAAREVAETRSICLLGDSVQEMDPGGRQFQAITMMDVIEHLPYPMRAIEQLASILASGGLLLISTGNSDALPWRLMRRDYWYYFGDHVSFFNPGWFQWAARRLQLKLMGVHRFSHSRRAALPGAMWERYRELARCVAFSLADRVRRSGGLGETLRRVYPFSRVLNRDDAPGTSLWPDHMLVVLKRGN